MRDVKDAIQKAVVNNAIDDELAELLIIDETKPGNIFLTLFKPGFFWLSMTGGGGWIQPPPENNVAVELGQ